MYSQDPDDDDDDQMKSIVCFATFQTDGLVQSEANVLVSRLTLHANLHVFSQWSPLNLKHVC